jgi:hypothetical protein
MSIPQPVRFVSNVDDLPLPMDVHVNDNHSIRLVGTNDTTATIIHQYYTTAAATATTRTAIYEQGTDLCSSTDVIEHE